MSLVDTKRGNLSGGQRAGRSHEGSPELASPRPLSFPEGPTEPITIRTSKKWVLPPRPKPGRKPSSGKHLTPAPKKRKRKSVKQYLEVDASLMENPIKQQILRINEENYYLKLEVIRLVTDLKSFKSRRAGVDCADGAVDHTAKAASMAPATATSNIASAIASASVTPSQPATNTHSKPTTIETTKPSPAPLAASRKRGHEEDVNDLIVSLIDLNRDEDLSLAETKRTKCSSADSIAGTSAGPATANESALESPVISEDDDLTSTVSTTPSTMLTSIKTNETADSLSGTTMAPSSPPFRLLDIPEGGDKDSFLFNGPASLVDDHDFGEIMPARDTHDDYYEFGKFGDVEMEFDNFINGRA